jgi:hypothetical protein
MGIKSYRQKIFAYIIRTDSRHPRLLVFACLDEPGFEVPKGRLKRVRVSNKQLCEKYLKNLESRKYALGASLE